MSDPIPTLARLAVLLARSHPAFNVPPAYRDSIANEIVDCAGKLEVWLRDIPLSEESPE